MNLIKTLPTVLICMGILFSCESPNWNETGETDKAAEVVAQKGGVVLLPQNKLDEKLKNSQTQLVDVRTIEEVNLGTIPGAIHMDYLDQATFQTASQNLDKTRPVVVYCASGNRSKSAALWLSENGFTEVYDLEGGYNSWDGGH